MPWLGSNLMRFTNFISANLADDKGQLLFQASSPPGPWEESANINSAMASQPSSSQATQDGQSSTVTPARPTSLVDAMSPVSSSSINTDRSASAPRPYVSTIGILPSSLPAYHKAWMEARKAGKPTSNLSNSHSEDHEPHAQTDAEKAETARRLNPHSRNQNKMDEASKRGVPGMTPVSAPKKTKPTKWQFGIRSRSQPLEAIGCIYRALQKLGATWTMPETEETGIDGLSIEDRYV